MAKRKITQKKSLNKINLLFLYVLTLKCSSIRGKVKNFFFKYKMAISTKPNADEI